MLSATAAAEPMLQDPTGDLFSDGPAGRTPFPAAMPALDLVGLAIEETEAQIVFILSIASAPTPDQGSHYDIGFQYADTEFRVAAMVRPEVLGPIEPEASLGRRPAGSEVWGNWAGIQFEVAGTVLRATVDKGLITNSVGLAARVGDELTGFWVSSLDYYHNISIVSGVPPRNTVATVRDHMPTDLVPTGAFTLAQGVPDASPAQLTSLRPLRWSNGEATSLVFDVTLNNFQGKVLDVTLTADGVPDGWDVTILRQGLRAPVLGAVGTPIVVAIPFRHEHGSTYSFNVTATDLEDGTILDTLELGVHYVEHPQPAGHHPTLYLHSDTDAGGSGACQDSQPFMSTLEKHPAETGCDLVPMVFQSNVAPNGYGWAAPSSYHWCTTFEAPLQLGLDLDLALTGLFQGTLVSTTPFTGTLTGRLLATSTTGDEFPDASRCSRTPVLALGGLDETTIDLAGQEATQDLAMAFTPTTDDLPFALGRNLVLELVLDTGATNSPQVVDKPALLPGGILDLPLLEYREQPMLPEDTGMQLRLNSPGRILRNPGDVGIFNLSLDGASQASFALLGLNAELASLKVAGGGLQVVVDVPSDAVDGTLIDVIVKADANDDFALARVVLEVDVDADHPSDALWAMREGGKQAPNPPALMLLALALSAALRSRRT